MTTATVQNIPYKIIEKHWNKIDFSILISYFKEKDELTINWFTNKFEEDLLKNEINILNQSSKEFGNVDIFLSDLKK
jgi:transcription initiation factor IIF auxiliary subunit